MHYRALIITFIVTLLTATPARLNAQTIVIPFSEIREEIDTTGAPPDVVIRTRLAGLIRDELDALGFDVNGGLLIGDVPVEEITEIIETDCDFFQPYEVHTDATTATVTIDDGSSLTLDLNTIRSINLLADLTGIVSTAAGAWVRWGIDNPFGDNCERVNTDHGRVALDVPFDISLDLAVTLDPVYDAEQLAIVVNKSALLQGQAIISGGNLEHDFGTASLTDLLINIFEDELLQKLQTNGEQAVADAIAELNLRLDGLDANGDPDSTLTAFNAPSVFVLDVSPEDEVVIRDLLEQYGIPDLVIALLEERAVEALLQIVVLEGAEREAYLASLGASLSCDVLLTAFQTPLDSVPLYTLNDQVCEVADLSDAGTSEHYLDDQCSEPVAYRPTDNSQYCADYVGDQSESMLGNVASWVADEDQVNDPLPDVSSRSWTTLPGTQLNLGVLSLSGNLRPYVKQLGYRTISNVSRGSGTCQLEMRVYKSDIAATDLRPLIALHGGTWRHRGSSFLGLEAGISHLTDLGFIVFAPFYRLVGESDGNVECNAVTWREVVADVESALDWVIANGTDMGAANEPVSVFGQSAGGHLAAWLAAHRPADVRKSLVYYGPTDSLAFLQGAAAPGGPFESFRDFGLRSLARFYGAPGGTAELQIEQIDFAGVTIDGLRDDWETIIPDTVFNLVMVDLQQPPLYLERCAISTQTDLAAINPGMPPAELVVCLKQDLRDFLIENSFNHQLADEAVPLHVVHGTADSLVPYNQALDLCGAIDGGVLPTGVTDPLTSYTCGENSETQLVQDAEHALELGVCLDSVCPAGQPDSDVRDAVVSAIQLSYSWLLQDPAAPPPPEPPPPSGDDDDDDSGLGASGLWTLFALLGAILLRSTHGRRRTAAG